MIATTVTRARSHKVVPSGVAGAPTPAERLTRRVRHVERQLVRIERLFGTVLEDVALLADDMASLGGGQGRSALPFVPRRPRTVHPALCATRVEMAPGRVTLVVGGLPREVTLTPLQTELVSLLATPTTSSPDHLVGFKTLARIVHGLRRRHGRVSGRSVTVAISRLRQRLGPQHGGLIETGRRRVGYRLRVVAADSLSCVARADR